jgi:FKBP-type peptidyl-prolyl cis-trans isomerase FklB
MKRFAIALCLLGLMTDLSNAQDKPAKTKDAAVKADKKTKSPFKTTRDKASYGQGLELGRDIVRYLERSGLDVDYDLLTQGLIDTFKKVEPKLKEEEIREAMAAFREEMRVQKAADVKAAIGKNKKEAVAFLARNDKVKGVVTTKSGLQYIVLKAGKGKSPTKNDTVKTHYRGTLLNGKEFDSSYKRNQPATFGVSGVIKGWTEALQLMKVGAKYKLFVPAELAYGDNPRAGGLITPGALLVFEVELLEIVK